MHINGQVKEATPQIQYSLDAEKAVLGSIIIDPDCVFYVSDFLSPTDFHSHINRDVYAAMLQLSSERRAIDVLTLTEQLTDKIEPPNGWEYYLISLLTATPTSVNVLEYARIVERWAVRRRMLLAANKIANLSFEEGDLDAQLGQAEMAVFNVRQGRTTGRVSAPYDYVPAFLNRLDERMAGDTIPGLPTGFPDLDHVLGGLQPGMPYILAARPGMGKSALAVNIAAHLALRANKSVLFFAPEMTREQVVERIISGECNVTTGAMRAGKVHDQQMPLLYQAAGRLSESRLYIDDSPGITPGQIRARAMRHFAEYDLDLIIVDHINEMAPDSPKQNRNIEMGDMARALKEVGKSIGCPMLIVAQLSRALENRADKRPVLSDLRDSGSLEEIAYGVMFLYRDSYYNEMANPELAELNVAKNRDGMTGTIDLTWKPNYTRFAHLGQGPKEKPIGLLGGMT